MFWIIITNQNSIRSRMSSQKSLLNISLNALKWTFAKSKMQNNFRRWKIWFRNLNENWILLIKSYMICLTFIVMRNVSNKSIFKNVLKIRMMILTFLKRKRKKKSKHRWKRFWQFHIIDHIRLFEYYFSHDDISTTKTRANDNIVSISSWCENENKIRNVIHFVLYVVVTTLFRIVYDL